MQHRLLLSTLFCFAIAPFLAGQVSVLTWHNDNYRSGQNLQETTLTPANVNASTFGKLFVLAADGKVDAQPLYVAAVTIPGQGVHNVLYVVTEHDSAYAFDADNGSPLWHVSLLSSGEVPSDDHGCGQVTPEIGATGTPVIDLQSGTHGTIYILAMSKDSTSKYHHRLHALDLTTGAEQFSGPVEIQATFSGSGAEKTFNPTVHKARPGLLLLNGVVYTTWGSHCDAGSYAGWVIGYNESTLAQTSVLNVVPNGSDAGIWNAGSGPAADSSGNLFVLTGNGTFDTTLNSSGFPTNSDFGNAFLKIATTGSLQVVDYFTMSNTTSESNGDVDLGSGGGMLLPPLNDSQGHSRSLMVGAGKDKHIYVLDRSNLGKYNSSSNMIYQDMPNALPGGVWGSPAWYNGRLYYGDVGGTLKAFTFVTGLFQTAASSQSANTFAYPGTTPSVSANGTSNGIVWAVENTSTAVLHAYDASDLSKELYNSNAAANGRDHFGAGNKFIVPTIANGKVFVGTTTGVGVFGLLGQPQAVSVSPNSGGGQTQTFSAVFTDPNGASDLNILYLDFGNTVFAPNSCIVAYTRSNNQLVLINDASTAGENASITPGGSGTISNSQCIISGAGGAVTTAGNNLTVPFHLTFLNGFAGTKNVFGLAINNANAIGGWQNLGSWTPATALPLSAVSVTPNSGSGQSQTFSAVYTDPNGASDLNILYLDFGNTVFAPNSCIVAYTRSNNTLVLINDASTAGINASITPGGNGTISNSQCTLSGAGGPVTIAGNNLTVPFHLTFLNGFTGTKNVFGLAQNDANANGGWQNLGSWTPGAPPLSAVSVTPNSGGGQTQVFSAVYTDPNGASDLNILYLDFGDTVFAPNSCIVAYTRSNNQLVLINDASTAGINAFITPGGSGTISNSQCTLSGAGGPVTMSGNDLTVPFQLTFLNGFAGTKNVFGLAMNNANANGGWQSLGSWTPSAALPLSAVSVTPNSGSGLSQTFSAVYTDPNGASDLNILYLDFGNSVFAPNSCIVAYTRSNNQLVLINDASTAPINAFITPGGSGTISNSQCTLSGAGGPVTTAGNNLTVPIHLTFLNGFTGTKNVFGLAQNNANANGGWQNLGSWIP